MLAGASIQVAENLYVQGGVLALNPPVAALSTLSRYDLVYYKVVDSRGIVVAGYNDLASPRRSPPRTAPFANGLYQGHRIRTATIARYMPEESTPGWALVTVAQTTNARQQLTNDMSIKVWTLILLMSVLAIGASGLAIRRGLRPLAQIGTIIAARDPADLRPVAVDTPSEIDAIIGSINGLIHRLAERINAMQRFIADAAHQMRTPLARLDAQIELLDGEADPARHAARLDALRATSSDVGRLTGQLLNHAMVIHRTEAVPLQPVGSSHSRRTCSAARFRSRASAMSSRSRATRRSRGSTATRSACRKRCRTCCTTRCCMGMQTTSSCRSRRRATRTMR